jgi:hypothetical protein
MFEVQQQMCSTCIYKPDSPLDIEALEKRIEDKHMSGFLTTFRQCHHSETACCRGFWEKHKNDFTIGQIVQRLGLVEFVNHDTLKGKM